MKYIKKFETKEDSKFKVGDHVRFNKNCSGDDDWRSIIFKIISIDENNNATLTYSRGIHTVDLNYLKRCLDLIPEHEFNANKYNL